MQAAEIAIALASGGVGFVLADGLDRWLATYDPAAAERPKDKFTSDGAGTLANTLNVASRPGFLRVGVGITATAVPAVAAIFVENPFARASLEGATIGSGISLFKMLWNNFLMPLLVGKDTSAPALQKSFIARLYPAEVAAHVNMAQRPKDSTGPYPSTGVLSQPNGGQPGVGAPTDVGPFAVGAESPYPDAAQALRHEAGVRDQFPSVQNIMGTGGPGSDYPTAAQAMGTGAPYMPGPPPGPGPGPQADPHTDPSCGCIGDNNSFLGFIGDEEKDTPFPAT